MGLKVILLSATLAASPAAAFDTSKLGQGGTLFLGDLKPLIDQSPKLRAEVTEAATKVDKPMDDILCGGVRFPGPWVHLGGGRVSPYECNFGEKWLKLRATVRVTGRSGRVYEKPSRDAMRNATRVRETNPIWEWTTEPPAWFKDP
jgi:hypothetical protein